MEKDFPFNDKKRMKLGLATVGKQSGNVWVLNQGIHVSADGELVALPVSPYAWQPIGGLCVELALKGQSGSAINMESQVTLLLESARTLNRLLQRMKNVFKHNFIAGKYSNYTLTT